MDEQMKLSACPEFEAVLEDYISDELSDAERETVAAHLRSCSACSAASEAVLQGREILRFAGEAAADPGPFFTRRVMSRISALDRRPAQETSFWKPLELFARRAVWASAGAVALLVVYVNLSSAPPQSQVAQVRQNDQTGLFADPSAVPANRDETFLTITDTRPDARHGE
jgi:anti-sigma factor RsiW